MKKLLAPILLLISCLMLYTVLIPIRPTLANDEKCHNVNKTLIRKNTTMAYQSIFDQGLGGGVSYTGRDPMLRTANTIDTKPTTVGTMPYVDSYGVPMNISNAQAPAGGGGGYGYGGGTSGGTYVDPAVAERQKRIAQANSLKTGITGIISNIKGVYDAIYGDVDAVGKEKVGQVDQRFDQETKSLSDQFNSQFPGIGAAYSSRGAYDSSYRGDAERAATTGYQNQVEGIGQERSTAQADVGRWVAGQQADVNANKGGLDAILSQIQSSENPDELQVLQNTLDERKRTLEASRAGLQSRDSYLAKANSLAPTNDRMAGLTASLTNVINSQVPLPPKRAIGRQLIANSGLPPAQAAQATATLDAQLQSEEHQ